MTSARKGLEGAVPVPREKDRRSVTESDLFEDATVTDLVNTLVQDHHVPGAQLAIRWGDSNFTAVVGSEEFGADRPMTVRSTIPSGSISKIFTATTVMMLAADEELDLDEPIDQYLVGLRNSRELFGRLTPRQLLSHTSGLPASLDEYLSPAAATSPRRYLAECARAAVPVCAPGTAFSYSNIGYVLVGYLVEVITGLSWPDAIRAILLDRLGIEASFVNGDDAGRVCCPGHSVHPKSGNAHVVRQTITPATMAIGGLALSASDLATFGAALVPGDHSGPELLDPVAVALMRQAIPGAEPFGLADGWGLGLAIYRHGDRQWVGHDGTGDGTSCHLRISTEQPCVVAFTSNATSGNLVWRDLVAELGRAGLPVADYREPLAVDHPLPPSPECFGRYVNGELEYSVAPRDGRPCIAVDGEVFTELAVHDHGVFSVRDPATGRRVNGGRFLANPRTGRISGLQTGGRIALRLDSAA
jgi:CubicO group peptidase (beta-lactamase class C family)